MSSRSGSGGGTALAGLAQLGAIAGPLVPWLVWLTHRHAHTSLTRDARAATNFGFVVMTAAVLATVIRELVPLAAFIGTLAQLVTLVVAGVLCFQALRNVRQGLPATYPYEFRVVK